MNLTDLQTRVDYRRRDGTTSFINTDETKAYLNEALRKVVAENEWEFLKTSASFAFTSGVSQYSLSAVAPDYKMPISMFYSDSYMFERVTPEQFRAVSSQNSLDIYAIDGDYLLVNTSFGSGTIPFHYYSYYAAKTSGGSRLLALSSSTDEPIIPERFQDMIVDYAAALCYQKEGMTDDYKIAYTSFLSSLNKMKREYPSRRATTLKRFGHINDRPNSVIYDRKENPLGH